MVASSSSSAGSHQRDKYEVFISFRGSDVRRGFISHLYPSLKAKQIDVFVDNNLERGKDITGNLFEIIEQSDLSIVIFSQNYPRSEWCLQELEKIYESMSQRKQIVVPVFYEVDPSDVQHLRGNYAIQLQEWRHALVEIGKLSGFDSKNSMNDAKLIEDIVLNVSMKLSEISPAISHEEGLFGIDSSMKDVEALLCIDSTNDVRMVGIWGMGGIGKTTLASKVFDRIKREFHGYCFVPNVRETLSTRNGLINLRDEIIQELLHDKNINISSSFSVDDSIRRRLKRTKVLLVLDDVQTCMQLNSVLDKSGLYTQNSLFPGSRIIVTSRDSLVLHDVKFRSEIYEVKKLEKDEALQIFSWHAFGQDKPQQGFENISQYALRYTDGVPLALAVLGSYLKHKEVGYWKAALKKYFTVGVPEILEILRISYDGLDREEKDIFLDIACIAIGLERKDFLEHVMYSFGDHACIGIDRLIDKSLLTERNGRINMHDLLLQMGREIVIGEKESKGQSRLWTFEDVKDALTNNKGTENVEAMELFHHREDKIDVNPEAFIPMRKLRYLNLANPNINCPMGLNFLPGSIKHLIWFFYPLHHIPSNYNPENLVKLELNWCHLKEINWNTPLMNLKSITIPGSHKLIRISDLAMAPNLETLYLKKCTNLVEIGSSLQNLNKLRLLNVSYCESLSNLPELPCSINELDLEGSGLRQLPTTIGLLTLLTQLSLRGCEKLESLPSSISSLSSLETICLSYCCNLQTLPEDFGNLESLKVLDAAYSGLRELPTSITNLKKLIKLNLIGCKQLHYLPVLPPELESLFATSLLNEVSTSIIDKYCWKVLCEPTKVRSLCVKGSQVPNWMAHRNEHGSSVSFDLETLSHSVNFIFCVVLSSNGPPDCSQIEAVLQTSEIEYCDDISRHKEPEEEEHETALDSEEEECYIVLWNSNRDDRFVTEVSFQQTLNDRDNGRIIKCAVHRIINNGDGRK